MAVITKCIDRRDEFALQGECPKASLNTLTSGTSNTLTNERYPELTLTQRYRSHPLLHGHAPDPYNHLQARITIYNKTGRIQGTTAFALEDCVGSGICEFTVSCSSAGSVLDALELSGIGVLDGSWESVDWVLEGS